MWIVARSCTFKTHWCFQKGVYVFKLLQKTAGDRRGRDRMVVGFTTIYAISAYHD